MYAPPDGHRAGAGEVPLHRDHRQGRLRRLDHADRGEGRHHARPLRRLDDHRHQASAGSWEQLDPVSAYAAQVLGVPGGILHRRRQRLGGQGAEERAVEVRRRGARLGPAERADDRAGLGSLGGILVIAGDPRSPCSSALVNPLDLSVLALVPGLFAVFAIELLRPGSSTKRTAAGPRPVVADRWLPADAVDAVEQGPLRLLRAQGALHRLHPVGGRLRRAPTSGRRSTAPRRASEPPVPAYFARLLRRRPHRQLRQPDGRRLLLDRVSSASRPTRPPSPRRPAAAAAGSPAAAVAAAVAVAPGDRHNVDTQTERGRTAVIGHRARSSSSWSCSSSASASSASTSCAPPTSGRRRRSAASTSS